MAKDKDPAVSGEKPAAAPSDDKIHISKSVLQSAREIQQHEQEEQQRLQEELQKKLAEREKKLREEHDRRLYEEKKELIRLKQGLIEESETIHEEHEEEVKLTFGQRISNFFYHNKWWLGIGVVCVCIFSFLIYSLVTRENPDIIVLVIGENQALGEGSQLSEYVSSFADDFNGNGEVLTSVYYVAYSDSPQKNYANGVDTKMTAELQSAEAVIVIGSGKVPDILRADEVFADLETLYSGNEAVLPHISGYAFILSDTPFAQRVGLSPEQIPDDWFIAIRTPRNLMYDKEEDMQETWDKDFPVLDKILNDLS